LRKWQDMQCIENCTDPDLTKRVLYEQPVWQTLQMFRTSLMISSICPPSEILGASGRHAVSVTYHNYASRSMNNACLAITLRHHSGHLFVASHSSPANAGPSSFRRRRPHTKETCGATLTRLESSYPMASCPLRCHRDYRMSPFRTLQ
jgi:hypothetical protein